MKTALQVVRSTWKFLVIAGIVVLIHLFMVDVDWQWDMTEAQIYSLSERSVETVQNLDKSLTIMFFHTDRSMGRSPVQPSRIRRLLKQYARTSVSVSFKEIDHARNPNMAKKHGVRQNNVIVLKSGKKTKKLGPRELFKFQRRARRRRPSRKFQGEQAITKAIMKLSEATDKTVYFATGHGEVQKQRSRRGRSVSAWSRALGEEGYNVQSWNPLTDNLPDTGNLIIMMGPSRSYSKSVSKQYRKWIRRGGKLIVGVNPPSASRVNPIVEPGGMSFQSRQIVDPNRRSRASLFNPFIFVPKLGNHPVLKSLKEQGVLVQVGRSAPIELTAPTAGGDTATKILITSSQAFSKPIGQKVRPEFNPETDRRETFTVGAVWSNQRGAKVVGLGNVTFLTNQMFRNTGNKNFALNLVNWIFERQVSLSIRPTPSDYNKVTLTAGQVQLIQAISMGLIPIFILAWGGAVWWKRKNL